MEAVFSWAARRSGLVILLCQSARHTMAINNLRRATKSRKLRVGFGKNITVFSCFFRELLVFWSLKFLKSRSAEEIVRNDHIYIQLMKQHMT